jgi:hypothetical protein
LKIYYCNANDPLSSDIVAPDDSDSALVVEPAAITPTPVARKRAKKAAPKKATVALVIEEVEALVAKKILSRKGKE